MQTTTRSGASVDLRAARKPFYGIGVPGAGLKGPRASNSNGSRTVNRRRAKHIQKRACMSGVNDTPKNLGRCELIGLSSVALSRALGAVRTQGSALQTHEKSADRSDVSPNNAMAT